MYFGAHWVPPCRVFIDHIKATYESADANGKMQVVFVSYDGNQQAYEEHLAKMPAEWLSVKLDDEAAIAAVSS